MVRQQPSVLVPSQDPTAVTKISSTCWSLVNGSCAALVRRYYHAAMVGRAATFINTFVSPIGLDNIGWEY
jgi:hypothetical protein